MPERDHPSRSSTRSQEIWARVALIDDDWQQGVRIALGDDGKILEVEAGTDASSSSEGATRVDILLPALANLHSHAFQRGMAGLSERRLAGARDSFWTWREVMYHFVERLTPDDVEAIASLVYVEMLEAGFAAVGEFHYLHHRADGATYDDPAELSGRIAAAAGRTGIGLTHLPVLYCRGGLQGEVLGGGQRRFGCTPDQFSELFDRAAKHIRRLPPDARLGIAPHSLRAVNQDELHWAVERAPEAPLHIHIAEQEAEVEAVETTYGKRPVDWLLDHFDVGPRWCLIHATQMTADETSRVAASGAVVGLCPITESNLGDGIFRGRDHLAASGRFGVGSDSNVRISLTEELRTLEYSQRLRDRERAVLVKGERSAGRTLYEDAARGGAQALDRGPGTITPGATADLLALRESGLHFGGVSDDQILDTWVFAADDQLVDHVWSAGRQVVNGGRHPERDAVIAQAARTLDRLRSEL